LANAVKPSYAYRQVGARHGERSPSKSTQLVQTRAREPSDAAGDAAIGQVRILENDGSGQRDLSDESIKQITANIAELDAIVADYETKRA
jgi:hypothetical protein